MERRVFLAIILSFVVLYGYQALFVPQRRPPQVRAGTTTSSKVAEAPQATTQQTAKPAAPTAVSTPTSEPPAVTTERKEREIVVDTSTVEAVLTNRGGRLLRWRLKSYKNKGGDLVDLVPSNTPAGEPRPFSLEVEEDAVSMRLNGSLYRVSGDVGGHVDATTKAARVVFEYEDTGGLRARKVFDFEPAGYVVTFESDVADGSHTLNPAIAWGPGLDDAGAVAGGGGFLRRNYSLPPEGIYHRDNRVSRISGTKLKEQPVHEGKFRFAGVDDHYFIAAAVEPGEARVEYRQVVLPGAEGAQRQLLAQTIRPVQSGQRLRFFVGPKQFDELRSVDQELVRAINFGIFGFLSVPLLNALKWVHGYVGNWGWSIIALTILINLAIAPLRHKSVVSMRKMQALQPQLKAIQDHYAGLKVTDPARQKMNTEVMNLYREKGVNPASGCVPMLLTIPILFAFYSLLSQAIELRGAEFGLWIKDLSEHDPYYVTPILMALTMFWQQRITPSTADPAQQKIMMMMPLLFGVMFLWVPSGLVLYWFVGNLWAIGQQYFTNWMIGPPATAAVRRPAARPIKSAGAASRPAAERKS